MCEDPEVSELPDLQFTDHGCFVSCWPETDEGEEWLLDNIEDDSRPLLIEHRFLADIVLGARAEGLVCHG